MLLKILFTMKKDVFTMNPKPFSKMLQIESYFNQIEVHKNHVRRFHNGLLNACYTHSTVLGSRGRVVSFQAI